MWLVIISEHGQSCSSIDKRWQACAGMGKRFETSRIHVCTSQYTIALLHVPPRRTGNASLGSLRSPRSACSCLRRWVHFGNMLSFTFGSCTLTSILNEKSRRFCTSFYNIPLIKVYVNSDTKSIQYLLHNRFKICSIFDPKSVQKSIQEQQ